MRDYYLRNFFVRSVGLVGHLICFWSITPQFVRRSNHKKMRVTKKT